MIAAFYGKAVRRQRQSAKDLRKPVAHAFGCRLAGNALLSFGFVLAALR